VKYCLSFKTDSSIRDSGPFGHIRMGRKLRGTAPIWEGAGSPSNTMWPGPVYLRTKWHLNPSSRLATMDTGRKLGAGELCPFWGGKLGPHLTQYSRRPRPTCMPSFILIHPTVWPQYTNVADRQTGQRSDIVGRTVLQAVAQKLSAKSILWEF